MSSTSARRSRPDRRIAAIATKQGKQRQFGSPLARLGSPRKTAGHEANGR